MVTLQDNLESSYIKCKYTKIALQKMLYKTKTQCIKAAKVHDSSHGSKALLRDALGTR